MRTYNKLKRHPIKFPYIVAKRFIEKNKEKIKRPAIVGGALTSYAGCSAFAGNYLEAIGAGLALVGGITAYIATSPNNDVWPFTEIKDRVYQPLQWFNGSKGPILEGPGTKWYLFPLVKKVKDEAGKIREISAQILARGCDFPFRTKDGLEGKLQVQYLYRVPDRKNAKQYFWEYGADPTKIDDIVKGELSSKIGSIEGEFVARGKYINAARIVISYLEEAEINANSKLRELKLGVEVNNFAILKPNFDPESEKILQQEVGALEAGKATIQKARATQLSTHVYLTAAKMIKDKGSDLQEGDIMLELQDRDSDQEVGETGGTIVKVKGMKQNPIIMPIFPKNKKLEPPSSP